MRVYISADLEGITGVSKWEETIKDNASYTQYQKQMTKEVAAACEAVIDAGATEVFVKDAHEDGKNLLIKELPKCVKVLSGWSNHPYNMFEGLDDRFDAVLCIGYHSGAGTNGTPLAHTLSPTTIRNIWINGKKANEFLIHSYLAYELGVPVTFVSGDGELIRQVNALDSNISTVAVQEGFGGAIISIHPDAAVERIYQMAKVSVQDTSKYLLPKQANYEIRIQYTDHAMAYKYSFYPNARQIDEYTISYSSTRYEDILTLLLFM